VSVFGELSIHAAWSVYDPRYDKPLYMLFRSQYFTIN